MTRVLHLLPSLDQTEAVAQAAAVRHALGMRYEFVTLRLGAELPWRGGFDLLGWRRLAAMLREQRAAVIHAWLGADDWLTLALLTRLGAGRVIASWRESEANANRRGTRFVAQRLNRILTPTAGLANLWLAHGIDPARVLVINDLISEPAQTGPTELPIAAIPNDAPLVVAVGRWQWSDHWREMIWSADLLKFLKLPVHVVFCGYGRDTARVERYRGQIEIADRVHLRPIDEAAQWLERATIFWSLRDDPGISPWLAAAQRRGLAVVASATHDHVQIIRSGKDGFLIPLGSRAELAKRTLQMLEDESLRRRIGAAGQASLRARTNSSEISAAYATVYDAVASGSIGAAPGGGVPPPARM